MCPPIIAGDTFPGESIFGKGEEKAIVDAGQNDDLKQIKGIGPKLETALNSHGIFRFEQIASWTEDGITQFENEPVSLKDRVNRDNWVSQAKQLADSLEDT